MARKSKRSKHTPAPDSTASPGAEHPHGKNRPPGGNTPKQPAIQQPERLFPIVGVGASAGGLEALTAFLKHLPSDSGMAFVLIQHLDPKHHSQLTELLAKATKMPILEVNVDTPVKPNHVYVMSPGVCLSMSDGHIRVEDRGGGRNLPIDLFLKSLAADNTSKAIGIVLSGTASDGTLGLKAVKAEGGITFAQEPSSARFDGMPRSAIAAGVVDFVLPPEEIAKRLVRLAQHPYVALPEDVHEAAHDTDSALNRIFHILRTATGNDFTHYKHSTLRRRIHRRMVLHADEKLSGYIAYLQENPAEVRALGDDLLICVTSFFRDPAALEALSSKVFPEILKATTSARNSIRVWVAGCSTGEEAYSIAICLTEFLERSGANVPFQIFATDISEAAIEKARAGKYPKTALVDVSPARLKRFFVKANGGYQIAKSIRDACIFARQNVTKDPPFHKLDLIACCNVLIYFGPLLQKKALSTFHYALKPGGFLMLGPSESVGPLSHGFLPLDKKLKLYAKQPWTDPLSSQFMAAGPLAGKDPGSEAAAGPDIGTALEVQKAAERMLLAEYAPAGVIIDDAMNIVHVRGDTAPYLQVASGEPTYNLLKMVREGLAVGLRTAILKAGNKKIAVSRTARVQRNGQFKDVHMKVTPVNTSSSTLHFIVLFRDAAPSAGSAQDDPELQKAGIAKSAKSAGVRGALENTRLKHELDATREYLQSIIEEQEANSEELKSANEEAQAGNEELETAKEELQSANEELNTLNDELNIRNAALTEVNSDLSNVLVSINVPLVMVGKDLAIRRFTPSMEPMLNLIDSDVRRSILDLKPNINLPDLPELLRGVIHGASPAVREIQGPKGCWYSLVVLPYRAPGNKIDGALLMLLDIDAIKHARDYAEAIVETVEQPLIVLTKDLIVRTANQAFYEIFKVSKEETENRLLYDLVGRQWDIPTLRQALEEVLPRKSRFQNFEIEHEFEGIGRKIMLLSAREIQTPEPYGRTILLTIADITARRRAEEAQAHLAAIVASSDDAIVSKTLDGVIVSWNSGAERMFGYTAQEITGQSILRLIPPELSGEEGRILRQVKAGERIEHFETIRLTKGGHRIPVSLTISPIKDAAGKIVGASKVARDITGRKRAEEAFAGSEKRLLFMAESMPQKIFAAKPSGDVDYFNRQWMTFTGLSFEQIEGWGWKQFIHPEDLEETVRLWRRSIDTGEPFEFVHRFRRADGVYLWHLSRAHAMLDGGGKVVAWIGSNTDIHEEKNTEANLRRANEDLKHFAYAVSHDLQEPLRMVTSYTQLLAQDYRGRLDKNADQFIAYAVEGAQRMDALLKGLREYWQASEQGEENHTTVDCGEALKKALLNLNEAIVDSGAVVTGDALPSIWANEVALVQLFQNLVGNAIKYRGRKPPKVRVSAGKSGIGEWVFSVKDNGIGVDQQYSEHVFDIFKRLQGKNYPGAGIGLAICKKVVERLGGRIWVESAPGRGSNF
ncbi:MAG: chemotaxis protein CheB, partial [Bryobacteraceae bacterium]